MQNEENIKFLSEDTHTEGILPLHQKPLITRVILVLSILILFSLSFGIILTAILFPQTRDSKLNCRSTLNLKDELKIVYKQEKPVLITNAIIFDGIGNVFKNYDLLIEKGRISRMEPHGIIRPTSETNIYNVNGRILTPGLIDMHSHLGVHSYPQMLAYQDYNEKTNPATPSLRVIDALRPNDLAIPDIVSGGVTTSLVLPGSCKNLFVD